MASRAVVPNLRRNAGRTARALTSPEQIVAEKTPVAFWYSVVRDRKLRDLASEVRIEFLPAWS